MQKILLTRSDEENQIITEVVSNLGFSPISCPMLSYKALDLNFTSFQNATDIIITSKFAAKIISKNYPYNVNCFVVGEESAEILKRNSHINIRYIANTAEELYEYTSRCNQKFLYYSGNIITIDFVHANRQIIYNVEYSNNLSAEVIYALQSGIKYLLLYSKNCASNLINLLHKYNLLQNIKNSVVIAISPQVASICEQYVNAALFPSEPKASKMIKLLIEYDTATENQNSK